MEIEAAPPKSNLGSKKKLPEGKSKKDIMFQIYRPNTGLQFKHESLDELEKKYKKVLSDEAESHWTQQYDASVNTCSHSYWKGMCRYVTMGQECEVSVVTCNAAAACRTTNETQNLLCRSVCDGERTTCSPGRSCPCGPGSRTVWRRASATRTGCR